MWDLNFLCGIFNPFLVIYTFITQMKFPLEVLQIIIFLKTSKVPEKESSALGSSGNQLNNGQISVYIQ